jgi:hypothetical protein
MRGVLCRRCALAQRERASGWHQLQRVAVCCAYEGCDAPEWVHGLCRAHAERIADLTSRRLAP